MEKHNYKNPSKSRLDLASVEAQVTKGCTDNVYPHDENGDPILPKAKFKELPIFDDKERAELKEIMLEALRDFHSKPDLPDFRPYRLDELQE